MKDLESKLWEAADNLRENSGLSAHDYAAPVLGLIFLKFADIRFARATEEIKKEGRTPNKDRYHAKRIIYLPENAHYEFLLHQPENSNIGTLLNEAMDKVEENNEDLRGVLPRDFQKIEREVLFNLLRSFNDIPTDTEEDLFGRIYEYFLGKFALTEGQSGGEFFTPSWIVKLIVNVIEPLKGKVFDPACGSGGMFVQSAEFVKAHKKNITGLAIYGQEKDRTTVKLGKMNLAIHGLPGDIKEGNTYYQDIHESVGKFDYVMANPPFNTDKQDPERIYNMQRFPFGLPTKKNGNGITQNGGNFIWAQIFYTALNKKGRAGFVMANGASSAGGIQAQIRQKLIETREVDVIIACPSNLFYNVQVPCTLWFYDKRKIDKRKDNILFIDARKIFEQIDAAHRKFSDAQIEFISNIVRLYRGKEVEEKKESIKLMKISFPDKKYVDVPGLCKIATIEEIEKKSWVLSPGRYIDIVENQTSDEDFHEKMEKLTAKVEEMFKESDELEKKIKKNLNKIGFKI